MDLFFIRHGQGEHTLDIPKSLHIDDPPLTSRGVEQAKELKRVFPLTHEDIIFISPLRRTLQTALIWSDNIDCRKIVTPFVSPRMFPIVPGKNTLPCDKILDLEVIKKGYQTIEIDMKASIDLWYEGINTIPESKFSKIAQDFIHTCKRLQKEKIYIVSHDGTITSYRQFFSGKQLSREDFPLETDWIKISC